MNKTRNSCNLYVFIILTYLYLYDPPLFFLRGWFAPSYLLSFTSLFLFVLKPWVVMRFLRQFRMEASILVLLLIYSVMTSLPVGDTTVISTHVFCLVNALILLPFFIYYLGDHTQLHENTIKILLYVCTLATLFSLMCILIPSFNTFVKNSLIQYSSKDYLFGENTRGYGIASLLTSNYGYVQGAIIAIGLLNIKKNRWFVFVIPFAFLSIFVNARTGILIAILGCILWVTNKASVKNIIGMILIILFVFCIGFDNLLFFLGISSETYYWMMGFQEEVQNVVESGDLYESSTASILLDNMWILPDTFDEWIFGRGFILYMNTRGVYSSDVGWINQLNYGGLIYLTLVVFLIIYMAYRLFKYGNGIIALFIIISFAIINTKSRCYPGASFLQLLFLLYYITLKNSIGSLFESKKKTISKSVHTNDSLHYSVNTPI